MDSSPAPLMAIHHASARRITGVPTVCAMSVRLLDGIDLTIQSGDCVMIRHASPATAAVLISLLRDETPGPAVQLSAYRQSRPRLRVRRASIGAHVVPAILEGWRSAPAGGVPVPGPPVVYALRSSRRVTGAMAAGSGADAAHGAQIAGWEHWARRVRDSGGAVVIIAEDFPAHGMDAMPSSASGRPLMPSHQRPVQVRESQGEPTAYGSPVRIFSLRQGRLIGAPAATDATVRADYCADGR